ncbi:pyridoxamine 5'-phosphate oxidase-domain-containing protein [Scheffersomyces coipomensis]|uniref:pyridoxamine 5'-phosphate oxidase-domain-containing protein n=1 Tax=Scheffersomyces coipomensis TaxID=1788519 RepID=UPI00315CB415
MLQFHYMAPWMPAFTQAVDNEFLITNNSPPFTPCQFSTIDSKTGYPKNRTLIYRGFLFNDKTNNIITFTTDKRMDKYQELIQNDKFECVFYFANIKKQFRFRGHAKIIDSTFQPIIDLSNIQPKTLLEKDQKKFLKRERDDIKFENNPYSDIDDLESIKSKTITDLDISTVNLNCQLNSIQSSVLSPSLLKQINDQTSASSTSLSNYTLNDISHIQYYPPTKDEWNEELKRQWNQLSKHLKKSFRKPNPLQPLNDDNQKLLDRISRGVDGKKDEDGFKNFAVIGLFVNYVDYVELDHDRRYIYEKDSSQQWSEQEVCP